ncbi:MAG TPA: hypothetical protein VFZ32_02275 [Micromonosporaceae bacterium]
MPALYYASHVDHTGEELHPGDLAEVARVWRDYRASYGLATPVP